MRRRSWILMGLLLVSCASGPKQAGAPQALRDRQAEEIIALDSEIRTWRQDAGLPPVPDRKYYREPETPLNQPAPKPQVPQSEECKDVCSFADHICENAAKICEIADEMPGDTWAKSKCDSAKASCNEARDRCENCGK